MIKICTIIGARPQFVKAAALSAKIAENQYKNKIQEIIIHTGQHYDPEMSDIFFNELNIPKEKYNMNIGSGNHGAQTGKMLEAIETILIKENPDWVLIYGDTNSTIAGALAAAKLHIKIAHIEAGMRSFNRNMPEEINRVLSDHIATFNLCSTDVAIENLKNEGLSKTAFLTGDIMYDCAVKFANIAEKKCNPLKSLQIKSKEFVLMTCHRAENTDDKLRLSQIVKAINTIAEKITVIYPIHPRTKKLLAQYSLSFSHNVKIIPPVGYFDMLILEKHSKCIITDSGGVQKEAFFFDVPCITMRDETEWVETITLGYNCITGANSEKITDAFANYTKNTPKNCTEYPYGNANAAAKILDKIIEG